MVQELQHQLASLQAEQQRVEADRQEMAVKQGNYKGTIAQVREQCMVSGKAFATLILCTAIMTCSRAA